MLELLLAALALACPAAAGSKFSGGDFQIVRHVERSGGERLATGAFILNDVVGETGADLLTGGAFKLQRGWAPLVPQPGSVVSITAVSKTTGTLDLAWNAPGLDGALGNVVAGFYRIDYSSEPAHVFDPTVFKTEFATSVVPGDAQFIRLTGLEVNTTYYAKIYLAGAQKYFAEDSDKGDESTLANLPINPVLVSVGSASVTISYTVPTGGAEGYQADGSSTNFGALSPGGAIVSSQTNSSSLFSLTISALLPNTTYYLRLASQNWQGDKNYVTIFQVFTQSSDSPLPIVFLVGTNNALARTVSYGWQNQSFVNPLGVMVVLSTNAAVSGVNDGASFTPGQVLGDASVIRSTTQVASFDDAALQLDTTYYFHFFSKGGGPTGTENLYSIAVTTMVFLDLPPMAPAALASSLSPDLTQVTLNWKGVISNSDGSFFKSTTTPIGVELFHYEVARATSIVAATWVKLTTVAINVLTYTDTPPDPGALYLYRIRAVDSKGTGGNSMAIDNGGDLYVFTPDQITHMRVPRRLVPELNLENNAIGSDLILTGIDQPGNPEEKIVRSVRFQGTKSPSAEPIGTFEFSKPDLRVSLRYEVVGGQIVFAGPLTAPNPAGLPAVKADGNLAMYWDNGAKFIKLFGKVDTSGQFVTVETPRTGSYQIRSLLRDPAFTFDASTLSNKVITPNGDGANDRAVFRFDNPRDSAFAGRIFDTRGAFVAEMSPATGEGPNTLQWDGKAGGRPVPGGVYVYQIRAEDKAFTGTLIVIR